MERPELLSNDVDFDINDELSRLLGEDYESTISSVEEDIKKKSKLKKTPKFIINLVLLLSKFKAYNERRRNEKLLEKLICNSTEYAFKIWKVRAKSQSAAFKEYRSHGLSILAADIFFVDRNGRYDVTHFLQYYFFAGPVLTTKIYNLSHIKEFIIGLIKSNGREAEFDQDNMRLEINYIIYNNSENMSNTARCIIINFKDARCDKTGLEWHFDTFVFP